MNIRLGILATLSLAGLLAACSGEAGPVKIIRGSGNVVTEERAVSGFTAVSLQGIGQLVVDQTGSESLTITTDDNLIPYIETQVSGNELIIRTERGVVFSDVSDLIYHVTVANLENLELDGIGQVTASHLSGDGLSVEMDGTGGITVSGEIANQKIEINGAGSYNAVDLKSQEATVKNSGAGRAVVQVSDRLDVTIDGVGSVEYIGDPQVRQEINGLGTVHQR